ncbi:MAG: FAD-dependent oxidoreductase [Fervidicoccaceae archaeon]
MRFLKCDLSRLPPLNGKRVAVIGLGPAGLGAVGSLICRGYEIIAYDAHPEPGGLLMFGIPEFRISKSSVREGVRELTMSGRVSFVSGKMIGRDIELDEAVEGSDAALIATGTIATKKIGINCEDSPDVLPSVEWLIDYHRLKLGYSPMYGYTSSSLKEPVGIIGGGLTAADAAQVSGFELKLKTKIIYRRSKDVAPMGKNEALRLERGGVEFLENLAPKEFLCDSEKSLRGGIFYRTQIIGKGREGKLVYGEEAFVDFFTAINAIGAKPTPPENIEKHGLKLKEDGTIYVDERGMTTREKIFAAGDVVNGPSKIGVALKSGMDAALSIDRYLSQK